MMDQPEKKRRQLYCPACDNDMANLFELIDHALISKCGMTPERLYNVGVLNDADMEQLKKTAI